MLHWMLESVNDMVRNKMVDGTELSERNLSGKAKGGAGKGLLDLLMFKLHMLNHLLGLARFPPPSRTCFLLVPL